jgi:hypothetical protein
MSAAKLDGTVCSAIETIPLPPNTKQAPTTEAPAVWRRVSRTRSRPWRRKRKAYTSRPAELKRAPALMRGGAVSTTTRMPR